MSAPMLEARGLTKKFGSQAVVSDLELTVRSGTITGFLGPNGAGKSTTMRMFLGLDHPSAGEALIDGRPIGDLPEPGLTVGALLSNHVAHPGRTAIDSLRWVARLLGVPDEACQQQLQRVGLAEAAGRRTGEFSLGMRQRLALAIAMMGDPKVLLLDEPMNGLDPQGIVWLRRLLEELRDEGRTIFLSSHLLREIEELVDDLTIIVNGRIVDSGTMADFLDRFSKEAVTVRCEQVHDLVTLVRDAGGQVRGTVHDGRATFVGASAKEIAVLAQEHRILLETVTTENRLEGAYEAATGENGQGGVQ